MSLRVRLLGEFNVRQPDGTFPRLDSARAESLLAYLLLHRDAPQSRQRLAFLLWPDSSEPQARTNLRHVLHNLRRAVPDLDRFVEVTSRTLRWRPDAPCWVDVAAFEESLARADVADGEGGGGVVAALRDAVALYRGDLLEGVYDEWLLGDRERLRQRYLQVLERLTALLEGRGEHAEAIGYAERLVRADPLREDAYRVLMRLHDARGDRVRALRAYHACVAALERELGVAPSAPTREAYEALLPADVGPAGVARETGPVGVEPLGGPPLVGRTLERARLVELWRAVERGGARLVLVSGEPGIGKTALVEELRSWCARRGVATAEARSYPAEGALAYGPVVAWLRSEALAGHLERLDRAHRGELAKLLPELRASAPDLPWPAPLPEGDQRQPLFDALAQAILASSGPLLLVADDLHWADRETWQFLHYLLRVRPEASLLVVATVRREDVDAQHPLTALLTGLQALERLDEIELGRLSRQETAVLAERFAGRSLQEADADRLFAETEGSPLFVVEALRAGWGGRAGARGSLSPKVQAVISARLAQLSASARELAGAAAVVGREFTTDVLAAASGVEERALVGGLDELWRRRIIRERGADAYDFTHGRIREVADAALGPARRRRTHLRVARALLRLHAEDPGPVAARLAAHHEQAGDLEEAVTWYERAAQVAQQLPATGEAVRLLTRALWLLESLPPTSERQARQLAVLTALQAPLAAEEGWSSTRLAEVQRRGMELADALRVEPQPPLLRSMAVASLARGDFAGAQRVGWRLHAGGERDADDMRVVEAEYVLGIAAFWSGELEAARRRFEAAVDRYRPEPRQEHLLRYGLDPRIICLSRLANTLGLLGRPQAARRARAGALALADELEHPHSHGTALVFAAVLALDLQEPELVRQYVAALMTRERDHLRPVRSGADALAGYLEVLDGQQEAGRTRILRVLDRLAEGEDAPGSGALVARVLLEASVAAGDADAGLAAADRALGVGGHARVWEAEARRLRGVFLARRGAPADQVEAELVAALQVAQRQGARLLQLRTAASLLRHRLECGDDRGASQARQTLATLVEGLTEAAETTDLREARALLTQSRA